MKRNLIFLVDDDPMSNVFNSMMIRKKYPSMEIIAFTSAEEALSNLRSAGSRKPALIFLDLNMPVLNGWDFLEEFQKLSLAIDITLLTSSNEIEDMARSKEFVEVKHYLVKPISANALEEVMKKFVL